MGIEVDSKSNIVIWMEAQPLNAEAFVSIPDLTTERRGRKRRRALEEMSDTNIDRQSEKTRRTSPRKTSRSVESEHVTSIQEQWQPAGESPFDILATPRASSRTSAPTIQPPLYATQDRHASPSRSSASVSTTRTGSPVKRIGDLQLLGTEINFVDFDNTDLPFSQAGRGLHKSLKRIFAKSQVIPISMKDKAGDLLDKFEIDESNFYECPHPFLPPQPKGAFKDDQTWELVGVVIKRARMCQEDLAPEAQWNTQVHARIFDLLLEGWREERGLWYMDVTTARIHQPFLSSATTAAAGNKLIDFAILLTPSRSLHKRIIATLKARSETTINHTKAEHLRYKPIVINFETKKPGEGAEGANVQLGVWTGAHFKRLKELAEQLSEGWKIEGDQRPLRDAILPCVMVQGHDWYLKIASLTSAEEVVCHRFL